MLYGYVLLKIKYLSMFSMKVCSSKLVLCITSEISEHVFDESVFL